jgi:hypothetical protein
MFLEGTLLEKLRKIEALHAGTTVDGEQEAARRAAERIRARLADGADTKTIDGLRRGVPPAPGRVRGGSTTTLPAIRRALVARLAAPSPCPACGGS